MFMKKESSLPEMLILTAVSIALTVPMLYYMKRIDDSLREIAGNEAVGEDSDY